MFVIDEKKHMLECVKALFIYICNRFFFFLDFFFDIFNLTYLKKIKIKSATASYLHLKKIMSIFFMFYLYSNCVEKMIKTSDLFKVLSLMSTK